MLISFRYFVWMIILYETKTITSNSQGYSICTYKYATYTTNLYIQSRNKSLSKISRALGVHFCGGPRILGTLECHENKWKIICYYLSENRKHIVTKTDGRKKDFFQLSCRIIFFRFQNNIFVNEIDKTFIAGR